MSADAPREFVDATTLVYAFDTSAGDTKAFSPTAADILAAIALKQKAQMSFWNAMIVHSASEAGCEILWSEDLGRDQTIRGVQIRHPFRD